MHWNLPLSDLSNVVFVTLMLVKVFLELIFVQVRFEAEDLLGNFLVFSLDAFELGFTVPEVQTFSFGVEGDLRVTFGQRMR